MWVVSSLLLLGFLGNSISSYFVSRENVRETITESSLPLTSDNIYSEIQRDVLRPIFISSMMANDAFLRDWALSGEQNVGQVQRYLEEIRREYDTVTSFFVSEQTRNYYYGGGILKQVDKDEPRDEWFFRVREMDQPFEINVDVDMANNDALTIFVNYRVFDYENNYIGVAGTGLTVNHVNAMIDEYGDQFNREIFFVGEDGTIVLCPRESPLAAYDNIAAVPGLADFSQELLNTQNESKVRYERDGKTYFLNNRWVPELNWYLMVEQSEDELLAPLRNTLALNVLSALCITVVVSGMCISVISIHQKRLKSRNDELSAKNEEIEKQQKELELAASDLKEVNAALSDMNREKDEFLGIVAHDLRGPLGNIFSICDILKEEQGGPQAHRMDLLQDIRTCCLQMQDLIGDLLNLNSIESFHGPVDLEPCLWNQLAAGVRERFSALAAVKNIELVLNLDPAADVELLTRGKWMDICLNNLVNNAIKYSPHGSRVEIETAVLPNGDFELRVNDEGPGIPETERDQLFQKFRRLSSRPTGGEQSSGLGLYIVRKMCQRLGATVELTPKAGRGCCFVIRHPQHSASRI